MKWLLNSVSSFFVNPEAYIGRCQNNYKKLNPSDLYNHSRTALAVGASSGVVSYILSGILHSSNPNLGLITGMAVGGIYLADRIHQAE